MMQPDAPSESPVNEAMVEIAKTMLGLAPGPLAELRRMRPDMPAAMFWRLAHRHPEVIRDEPRWVRIVQAVALLAPKGDPATRPKIFHNRDRSFGAVMCDGGNPAWPEGATPRPFVSEMRFNRLLATTGEARAEAVVRAARVLAPRMQHGLGAGINVHDIAWAVLKPENVNALASTYFARLDAAESNKERSSP